MNCKTCGNPLTVEDKFCKKCGTAVMKVGEEVANTVNNTVNQAPVVMPSVEPKPVVNPTPVAPASPTITPVAPIPAAAPSPTPVAPAPVAPVQPTQPNMVNPAPMSPPKAKTNPILLIIIALLAVAAGYFGYKALFANDDGGSIIASGTNKINYDGYSFEIPKDYSTKITSEGLEMDNDVNHFELLIETGIFSTYDFKALNGNHDGLIFTDKGEKAYGATKYRLYELTFQEQRVKAYFIVFDMGGTRVGMGIVGSNVDPYSLPSLSKVDDFMKIVTTGKYTGSNSMEDETFSMSKVMDAIGKSSEEANTGDYVGEYTDTYVNIMTEEINE